MTSTVGGAGQLLAISDLHIGYQENRALVERMRPETDDDWLLVAGDVAETVADIRWALKTLAGRFRKVVWAPGQPRTVDPPQATPSPCAASPATSTWSRCAGNSA